jgi:hypothetical protein
MASYHAKIIARNNKVQHGWWGALYLGVAAAMSIPLDSITLFIASLFIRKVFFDSALNLFRPGLGLFYVSPELARITTLRQAIKKGKTIDWLHYKAFGENSEVYMFIYLAVIAVLTMLLLQ